MGKKSQFTVQFDGRLSPEYMAGEREIFFGVDYLPPIIYANECRYKNLRTIQDNIDKKVHHELWVDKNIINTSDDEYFIVTNVEKDRLDIVAAETYGTARFWWVIALANNIKDPFDVPVGTSLRIPPKQSLYISGGVLSG